MRCVSPSPWSSSVRDTCTLSSDYPRLFVFWLWWWSSPRCGPPGRAAPCEAPPRRSSARTQWHGRARAWSASVSGNVGWKWAGRGRRVRPSATRRPWTLRTTVTAMAQTWHVHSDRPSQSGRAAWPGVCRGQPSKPLAHARLVRGTRTHRRGVPGIRLELRGPRPGERQHVGVDHRPPNGPGMDERSCACVTAAHAPSQDAWPCHIASVLPVTWAGDPCHRAVQQSSPNSANRPAGRGINVGLSAVCRGD